MPRLPGLASLHAIARGCPEPSDRLVWERRTLFGDEPQVRTLSEFALARQDFAGFRHFAVHPALSSIDEGEMPPLRLVHRFALRPARLAGYLSLWALPNPAGRAVAAVSTAVLHRGWARAAEKV